MKRMNELLVGTILVLLICALFLAPAWNYWHGRWLRSIAGNTVATDEELASPEQKRLGKRMSAVMLVCTASLLLLLGSTYVRELGGFDFVGVAIFMAIAGIVGSCAWVCLATWRDNRAIQKRSQQDGEPLSEDAKLDRRAGIVLAVILGIYLIISFVVAPLAKG
ncbi:DUF3784 domain-containing protein [Paraeggerthella hongkongensis]|uniref:DUF3784 domain-containing protein n=1 Tax=Paraeggerthella hongkongensis TaxID=230658 RepID=A0A3N0AVB3_9ACTN|nr:DUF3784 domain-containing protein [Paraeggerthella hongkongensis]RNL38812.1 hypothetical protein DMP08_11635 [Paraeggerthella hongkongensis]